MKAIIVGGGTAGWVTLSYLAATTDLDLTIMHSNEIDIIGVGESTTPALRHVAKTCGVDESSFMRDGKATWKFSIDFRDWMHKGSRWLHTFDDTQLVDNRINSLDYFLRARELDPDNFGIDTFNLAHGPYHYLIKHRLSTYSKDGKENLGHFQGPAYHVNAYEFGQSLRKNTNADRYTEIEATIDRVEYDDNGIKELILKDGTSMTADIYIDCTGFHRVLSKGLTDFHPYKDMKNDRAIFGTVKGVTLDEPVTGAWAQDAGWIWNIPTYGQVGSGHVYCGAYQTDQRAEDTIRDYWRQRGHEWTPTKKVEFTSGRLERIATKNLITNGLGQSFIEPLEATSIMVTCVTAMQISQQYNKHNTWNDKSSDVLNTVITRMLEETKDYVRCHYDLSNRTDSDYWNDCRRPEAIQEVCDYIDKTKRKPIYLNGFNWISMLVGYEKPYLNETTKLDQRLVDEYMREALSAESRYEEMFSDNLTVLEKLDLINK
jgi:tryptophan halogenase